MSKRYFFVSTVSMLDGVNIFNSHTFISLGTYPSFDDIVLKARAQNPSVHFVNVLGITEMSETDYKTFRGE